jgi:hypothetical protein
MDIFIYLLLHNINPNGRLLAVQITMRMYVKNNKSECEPNLALWLGHATSKDRNNGYGKEMCIFGNPRLNHLR